MSHQDEVLPPRRDTPTDPQALTFVESTPDQRRHHPATLEAIDRVVANENVTVTEAVRRLVTYGDLV